MRRENEKNREKYPYFARIVTFTAEADACAAEIALSAE
jgi:hypothetical protein